ncbi:hypothetical protein DPEC_G00037600 [Dallia pectoralis]|uniref:Uncharacterized protein n=1 Tax=Dallia pectoralis TaxID=75939 RepID=A0ACC2HFA5_DALPE|nr:hypothetical protein DPEC_G00037600 [Dallia pectoralis]
MNGESSQRHSPGGVDISGIPDPSLTDKNDLKEDNDIVAVTINLNHLSKDEKLKLFKIIEPYDDNMRLLKKQDLPSSVSSLERGLKGPKDMLTNTYSRMQQPVETPAIKVEGLSGQLNAESKINGPTLNGNLPNVTLNTPGTDGGAKFTMPTIGMSGPVMKGADLDGNISIPKVSLSTPKLSTSDASPDLQTPVGKRECINRVRKPWTEWRVEDTKPEPHSP